MPAPFFCTGNIIRFIGYSCVLTSALLLIYFIYAKGFSGPMLFDDQLNLQTARLYTLDWHSLIDVMTHNYSGMFGRGISSLTFGLTHYFHGEGTYYFKYHNFLIHCLTGLGLFYLGYRLLLLTQYSKNALLVAALSAFIWLIHPIHVSTVLYIVQRMAQLSTLFVVCALICYVVGRVRIEQGRRFGLLIIFTGYPFFILLGLLSKENAALCTLFTLVIEGSFFVSGNNSERESSSLNDRINQRNRKRCWARIFFIVLPLIIGVAGFLYKLDSFLAGYDTREFSLYERVLTQIHVVFYYLQLILLPRLSEYSLYHDDFATVREFSLGTFLRLSLIMGMLFLYVRTVFIRRDSLILFGFAWFIVAHAMESTIVPLEMIFEHRNYLALWGVSVAISVFLVVHLPKLTSSVKFPYSIAGLYCLICIFILNVRVDTWRTAEQLSLVNVTEHPASARSHTDRANVLGKYGDGAGVIRHLSIAYELQPWNPGAAIHRLSAACVFYQLSPQIIEEAIKASNGAYLTAYTWIAIDNLILNIELNQCKLDEVSIISLLNSIDFGRHGTSLSNQARKHFYIARFYQHLGDVGKTISAYNYAIENDRKTTAYAVYKTRFLIDKGLFQKAESQILSLIEQDKESIRDETLIIRSLLNKLMNAKALKAQDAY